MTAKTVSYCREYLINLSMGQFRPDNHVFFQNLKKMPKKIIESPPLLNSLYLNYQAAMHATRVMVYFLPGLNSPMLRKKKLQIFIDDDGLPGGDTHHYQLSRLFKNIGADDLLCDEDFGDLGCLKVLVAKKVACFIETVERLYTKSTGAWCVSELFSENWLKAFCDSLSVHFSGVSKEPYFYDCFSEGVEERHGDEALDITLELIRRENTLTSSILAHADEMAQAFSLLWDGLDFCLSQSSQHLFV